MVELSGRAVPEADLAPNPVEAGVVSVVEGLVGAEDSEADLEAPEVREVLTLPWKTERVRFPLRFLCR